MEPITFTVFGRPQQRGSKRAVLIPKRGGGWAMKNGRPIVAAKDMNEKSKDWMHAVAAAAMECYRGELLRGPVCLKVTFFFARPKSHFGTGRNANVLKESAPLWHAQAPDVDKLQRSVLDALTNVLWADDKLIADVHARKFWTTTASRAILQIIAITEDNLVPSD